MECILLGSIISLADTVIPFSHISIDFHVNFGSILLLYICQPHSGIVFPMPLWDGSRRTKSTEVL